MTHSMFKEVIKKTCIYDIIRRWRYGSLYLNMEKSGNLAPPPYEVKRLTILLYAKLYHLTTFVETGTYLGDTVDALKCDFEKIYSIELQHDLYDQAKRRFADFDHIHVIFGDSGKVLPEILGNIHNPCLFWLDGHYSSGNTARGSKDTPIIEELSHILSHSTADHVILIDDARLFNGQGDYPTLNQIRWFIHSRSDYLFDIQHDIIRVLRKQKPTFPVQKIPKDPLNSSRKDTDKVRKE